MAFPDYVSIRRAPRAVNRMLDAESTVESEIVAEVAFAAPTCRQCKSRGNVIGVW
jgi:hypothetical protein